MILLPRPPKRVLGMDSICFLLYDGINWLIRRLDTYASLACPRDLVYLACRYRQPLFALSSLI